MNSTTITTTTAAQSRIGMPTLGASGTAWKFDAPAVKHAAACIGAAPVGTSVWRPPPA